MVIKTVKSCYLVKAVSVDENDSVIDVAKKIHHFQERRVYVLNSKKFPIGIISVVDINDRVVAQGKDLKKTKAKDIMSFPLEIIADVNDSIKEIFGKMVQRDNFYVPVIENNALKGILTYASAVKELKN